MLLITVLIAAILLSMVIYAFNKVAGFVMMQIALALFIVYSVYYLSLWVLRRDKLVVDDKYNVGPRTKTLVFDGWKDSFNLQNTVIDTVNPASMAYASLPRSLNRFGGAQFTYQFWMVLDNTSNSNIGNKDIIVRGDVTKYNIMTIDMATGATLSGPKEDIVIKCPRIRFNGSYRDLAVEVNTIGDPNPPPILISGTPPAVGTTPDTTLRHGIFNLIPNKWVLYTFVFQDNVQVNDFENGVETQFYINDLLYQTSTMRSAIRQNNGNLYLFPSGVINGCKIGNLAYYNYALSSDEIASVYRGGPPRYESVSRNSGPVATPLFLTEYNKLDIYNS